MKATHRLTCLPNGDKYLLCVVGDEYHWSTKEDPKWHGPFSQFDVKYLQKQFWLVERVNTFKGNK